MNRTSAAIAALLLVLVAGVAGIRPASAHEGEGILTLESQQVAPDGSASYQVRLTWENDGHAAIDSTVTATPIAPDGTQGVPVIMDAVDQDGRYAGNLTFPDSGTWTIRFTAVTPAATSEVVEEVAIAPSTSDSTDTTTAETATSAGLPSEDGTAAGEIDEGSEDSGSSTVAVEVVTLLVVLLLLLAVVLRFSRSNRRLRDGS
jgi:hypothetical protein